MATMSGLKYPISAIRTQIADAIDVIIQVARMRDGHRRVVQISEVVGTEGDVIVTQDLFKYVQTGETEEGMLEGTFEYTGLRPHCGEKLNQYGFEKVVMEALQ